MQPLAAPRGKRPTLLLTDGRQQHQAASRLIRRFVACSLIKPQSSHCLKRAIRTRITAWANNAIAEKAPIIWARLTPGGRGRGERCSFGAVAAAVARPVMAACVRVHTFCSALSVREMLCALCSAAWEEEACMHACAACRQPATRPQLTRPPQSGSQGACGVCPCRGLDA